MYNGQFLKAMIHVVIFAVLISITSHYKIFLLFVFAWVLYQAFEAFHTAKARREGLPLPDPFGLNELSSYLNLGRSSSYPPQPGVPPQNPVAGTASQATAGAPGSTGWQTPYTGQYPPPNPIPPVPPVAPFCWPNRTPIGAIVLIGMGLLFLMDQFDFFAGRVFKISWPLGLIALGVWLAINRVGNSQGGSR
jgi:hypothetical protein